MTDFRSDSPINTLFDPSLAEACRDQGIARAKEGTSQLWLAQAERAVLEVARKMPSGFTVDDVQELLASWGVPPPSEGRAMGAVMAGLRRDGCIVATDRFLPGRQVKSHRNPRRVWVCGNGGGR